MKLHWSFNRSRFQPVREDSRWDNDRVASESRKPEVLKSDQSEMPTFDKTMTLSHFKKKQNKTRKYLCKWYTHCVPRCT